MLWYDESKNIGGGWRSGDDRKFETGLDCFMVSASRSIDFL